MFRTLFNKIRELHDTINEIYNLISLNYIISNNTENKEKSLIYLQKMKNVISKIENKLHSTVYRLLVKDDELVTLIDLLEDYEKQLTNFDNNKKCPMCLNKFNYHTKNKHDFN